MSEPVTEGTTVVLAEGSRDALIREVRAARGPQESIEDTTRSLHAALNLALELLGITNQDIDNFTESVVE